MYDWTLLNSPPPIVCLRQPLSRRLATRFRSPRMLFTIRNCGEQVAQQRSAMATIAGMSDVPSSRTSTSSRRALASLGPPSHKAPLSMPALSRRQLTPSARSRSGVSSFELVARLSGELSLELLLELIGVGRSSKLSIGLPVICLSYPLSIHLPSFESCQPSVSLLWPP